MVGFDVKRLDEVDPLALGRRRVRGNRTIEERRPAGIGRLGRPHDDPVLVDPDAARDIHDTEQRVHHVRFVDKGGMVGRCLRDPRTCALSATRVERDGHDLEALRPELRAQLLPNWQVKAAASPRSPCEEQDLRAA